MSKTKDKEKILKAVSNKRIISFVCIKTEMKKKVDFYQKQRSPEDSTITFLKCCQKLQKKKNLSI